MSPLGSPKNKFWTDGARELFVSVGPGRIDVFFLSRVPVTLITNRCLFSFADGQFTLQSVHPGHAVEEVIQHTGIEFVQPSSVSETPSP